MFHLRAAHGTFHFVSLKAFEEFVVVFRFFFLLAFRSWKCPKEFWVPWLLLQMGEEHWCCALVDKKSLECGSHSPMKQNVSASSHTPRCCMVLLALLPLVPSSPR